MYKHNDHYLKFCILQRSFVLTVQKVNYVGLSSKCGDFVVKNLSHRQQRLLTFQNEHLFVFYDQQSTQSHTENVGSMNEAFWIRQ